MGVEIRGLKRFIKKLDKSEDTIKNNLLVALKTSTTVVQTAAKRGVARGATGDLSRSIVVDIKERILIGIVGLDFPGKKYGIFVEKGSRPHFVPIKALERWSAQKGISPFAVQKSIARKGTKPHPFMIPAFKKNQRFIENQFSIALKNIVQKL